MHLHMSTVLKCNCLYFPYAFIILNYVYKSHILISCSSQLSLIPEADTVYNTVCILLQTEDYPH